MKHSTNYLIKDLNYSLIHSGILEIANEPLVFNINLISLNEILLM